MFRSTIAILALLGLAVAGAGQSRATDYDSGGSPQGAVQLKRASIAAYHGHYTDAIAIAARAIGRDPAFAFAYLARSRYEMDAGRYGEARADLERVARFHPDSVDVPYDLAQISIREHDGRAALAQLDRLAAMPTASVWHASEEAAHNEGNASLFVSDFRTASQAYAMRSLALQLLSRNDEALQALQGAMQNETLHPWYVLNAHCYEAAVAGLLDMAELTCGEAVSKATNDASSEYDSLGFVHLKQKKWTEAVADYGKALSARDDLTISLYGRGVARLALGDKGGAEDLRRARAGEPDIDAIMKRLGAPAPSA